ncbi:hypothetical protein C1893_30665 [Pseudomonas sp. MPR-ANC1]|nr:hypothetical protein C1893_30665 [Pseudomonas sp. MPR-ANC1]
MGMPQRTLRVRLWSGTRSAPGCIPTRSVGTINQKIAAFGSSCTGLRCVQVHRFRAEYRCLVYTYPQLPVWHDHCNLPRVFPLPQRTAP